MTDWIREQALDDPVLLHAMHAVPTQWRMRLSMRPTHSVKPPQNQRSGAPAQLLSQQPRTKTPSITIPKRIQREYVSTTRRSRVHATQVTVHDSQPRHFSDRELTARPIASLPVADHFPLLPPSPLLAPGSCGRHSSVSPSSWTWTGRRVVAGARLEAIASALRRPRPLT